MRTHSGIFWHCNVDKYLACVFCIFKNLFLFLKKKTCVDVGRSPLVLFKTCLKLKGPIWTEFSEREFKGLFFIFMCSLEDTTISISRVYQNISFIHLIFFSFYEVKVSPSSFLRTLNQTFFLNIKQLPGKFELRFVFESNGIFLSVCENF